MIQMMRLALSHGVIPHLLLCTRRCCGCRHRFSAVCPCCGVGQGLQTPNWLTVLHRMAESEPTQSWLMELGGAIANPTCVVSSIAEADPHSTAGLSLLLPPFSGLDSNPEELHGTAATTLSACKPARLQHPTQILQTCNGSAIEMTEASCLARLDRRAFKGIKP